MRIKNLETSRKREVALLLVARKNSQNLQNSQKRAHLRPEAKTAKRLEISGWPWAKTTVEMFHISEMPKACKFVGAQNPRDTLCSGSRLSATPRVQAAATLIVPRLSGFL